MYKKHGPLSDLDSQELQTDITKLIKYFPGPGQQWMQKKSPKLPSIFPRSFLELELELYPAQV